MSKILPFFLFFYLSTTAQSPIENSTVLDSILFDIEKDIDISQQLTSKGFYPKAYDKIWNALILADSLRNPTIKYKAYKHLSMLYSIFNKKEQAIATIDSAFLYAKRSGDFEQLKVKSNLYYTAALTYRMNNSLDKAKEYLNLAEEILDSLKIPKKGRIYLLSEKAHFYMKSGNFDEAEKILNDIITQIPKKDQYATIIYGMLGDLYSKKKEYEKALKYYNKSLKFINLKKQRIGIKVDLLRKLAKINADLGKYKLAYQQIKKSKALGDKLFGSRSSRNSELFEIKDEYRKTILANKRIQESQRLQLIEAQNDRFKFIIILLFLTLTAAFFIIRSIKRKHQFEKKLAEERANAEIEIKKKELAVTALQLMEKEKLLEEIKKGLDDVKEQKNDISVEKIKSTISVNSAKTWEEFEARFVQVNSSFYQSLGEKHPNLSRNELKLCALVKLNFSTKEMAQLLGISTDGVNKARYRLRKKLNLQRDVNLVSYIYSI